MMVQGCPLTFQMTMANPDQKPILRYGTMVAGTAPVTRRVIINNDSPLGKYHLYLGKKEERSIQTYLNEKVIFLFVH